jgi:hypothetical protein
VLAYLVEFAILVGVVGTRLATDPYGFRTESKCKMSKQNEVTSNLDVVSAELVESGAELIGKGEELETAWFWKSIELLEGNLISVRGVQMSMEEVLAPYTEVVDGVAKCDVKFPSLTYTMVQNFKQAAVLMRLSGWEGSPVQAIRTIQNGKRSEAFESAKDFDKELAVAKSAKAIEKKANQPKRASVTKPKVEGEVDSEVQTFGEAVEELAKVAKARTSHTLTPNQAKEALYLIGIFKAELEAFKKKVENLDKVAA